MKVYIALAIVALLAVALTWVGVARGAASPIPDQCFVGVVTVHTDPTTGKQSVDPTKILPLWPSPCPVKQPAPKKTGRSKKA